MKIWKVATADKDCLEETLNWIEEQKGEVFSVLLIRGADAELGELYRVIYYTKG